MANTDITENYVSLFRKSQFASRDAFCEQIIYLLFARLLGRLDLHNQNTNKEPIFIPDLSHLRWEHIISVSPEEQLRLINGLPTREEQEKWEDCPWMNMFLFFRSGLKNTVLKEISGCFLNAECRVNDSQLLSEMIRFVDDLPIEGEFRDNFNEYLTHFIDNRLGRGEFYTPKNVTQLMTALSAPSLGEMICDPACGSGNFLAEAIKYSQKKTGQTFQDFYDSLDHIPSENPLFYYGYDINGASTKLAVVYLLLYHCSAASIAQTDSIGRKSQIFSKFADSFDKVVLEPPFNAMIRSEDTLEDLISIAKTYRSEILFLALAEHILKKGGRGVVCVPSNFLYQSTSAHETIRERLVEKNRLEAVVFLPQTRRFTIIKTALLVFTKDETTDKVLFYNFETDTDSKKSGISDDDVNSFLEVWNKWKTQRDSDSPESLREFEDKENNYFYVTREKLVSSHYILSLEKHQIFKHEELPPPDVLFSELQKQEEEINSILKQLKIDLDVHESSD